MFLKSHDNPNAVGQGIPILVVHTEVTFRQVTFSFVPPKASFDS